MSIRCGTPSTMAPEIYFQPDGTKLLYDKKCDVWSLGVIIHEIVYRKHPFDCNI
jgi:serine/threonine protein kinase